jgi:hypothetical protein
MSLNSIVTVPSGNSPTLRLLPQIPVSYDLGHELFSWLRLAQLLDRVPVAGVDKRDTAFEVKITNWRRSDDPRLFAVTFPGSMPVRPVLAARPD